MDVLVLNKRDWEHPRSGGAEKNMYELFSRLAGRGHNITVLTSGYPGCKKKTTVDGMQMRRIGSGFSLPQPLDTLLAYFVVTAYFHYYQFTRNVDVVYYSHSPLPWLLLTPHPTVAIYHHIALDSIFETHSFPFSYLGYLAYRIGIYLEKGSTTICVSNSTAEVLRAYGHDPSHIEIVRNGINIDKFDYKPLQNTSSGPKLLYLGGLDGYKGADRLPAIHETVERLRDEQVQLNIAGREGDKSDVVERYCNNTQSAVFHGFISEEKKISLLEDAWLLVVPSRVEGWGMVVIEANACGTPAVGADIGGLQESIRHTETGILSDASDISEFSRSISALLDSPEDIQKMGANGRAWAEKHSWTEAADRVEKTLRRAAGSIETE